MNLRAGIYLPNYGPAPDPGFVLAAAAAGRAAGWDGIFLYDQTVMEHFAAGSAIDPWTTLAAAAQAVPDIMVGVTVTAPGRRHLGQLAQQASTLQALSGGRLIVGLGLGEDADYEAFGVHMGYRERAAWEQLALELLPRWWACETLTGRFSAAAAGWSVSLDLDRARTGPALARRPELWVGCGQGAVAAVRRAARSGADAVFPLRLAPGWDPAVSLDPADYVRLAAAARQSRGNGTPLGFATAGQTEPGGVAAAAKAYDGLGWWMETMEGRAAGEVLARIGAGPS